MHFLNKNKQPDPYAELDELDERNREISLASARIAGRLASLQGESPPCLQHDDTTAATTVRLIKFPKQ